MFSLKGAKEWASGFLSDAASTTRPNLEEFLQEVSTENTEHLFFQKAVDDKLAMQNECKPSYEQLSQNSILVEANRNLAVLRAFDVILQERCVMPCPVLQLLALPCISFPFYSLTNIHPTPLRFSLLS